MSVPVDFTEHVNLEDFVRAFWLHDKNGRYLVEEAGGLIWSSAENVASRVICLHLSSRSRYAFKDPEGRYLKETDDGQLKFVSKEVSRKERFFLTRTEGENGHFLSFSSNPLNVEGTSVEMFLERITKTSGIPQLSNYGLSKFGSIDEELERFGQRVAELQSKGEPVRIYVGCGLTIRPGFLNVDLKLPTSNLVVKEELPNVFRFPVGVPMPIADSSVDYVLSEDFLEHLPQLEQVKFLAESYRILKTGAINRVNTPCLAESMNLHSNFVQGAKGVYEGEWLRWGHVNVLTESMLAEMARIIGYSRVQNMIKDHSLSEYHDGDVRPKADRDKHFGNIYADLVK